MAFYFAGSIRGGREDVHIYEKIIRHLKSVDDVLTEHVGDYSLSLRGQTHLTDQEIHDRDVAWLRASSLVVAEVTRPSLGVGYEIAVAVENNIPVLALHRSGPVDLSAMIGGSSGITTVQYAEVDEALHVIDAFLESRGTGRI